MTKMQKNTNVQFEIYDLNGNLLEKLDGPGDIGVWISSPVSPFEMTILPIAFKRVKASDFKSDLYRVVRTRLSYDLNEVLDESDEIIMVADYTVEEVKELAKKMGCDHFYHIHWDADRYIFLFDLVEDDEALYAMSPEI
jgi:hypothetical protein